MSLHLVGKPSAEEGWQLSTQRPGSWVRGAAECWIGFLVLHPRPPACLSHLKEMDGWSSRQRYRLLAAEDSDHFVAVLGCSLKLVEKH